MPHLWSAAFCIVMRRLGGSAVHQPAGASITAARRQPAQFSAATTTAPKPISWANWPAACFCPSSSLATNGRAATTSRSTAALLSTIETTCRLTRRTKPSDSAPFLVARKIAQGDLYRPPIAFLLLRQLEDAFDARDIDGGRTRRLRRVAVLQSSGASGRDSRQQTKRREPDYARAKCLLHSASIPDVDVCCMGAIAAKSAAKAYEMRAKCDFWVPRGNVAKSN